MLAHKLVLDDDDSSFKLIAIHCSSEEYKLAFLLNRHLNIRLARTRKDHDFVSRSVPTEFALYKFNHHQQYCDYYLISNKFRMLSKTQSGGGSLFGEEAFDSNLIYLLPQYKQVDYLLKIEEEYESVSEKKLLEQIKEISQVATAYSIETENLKFKENLIFD